jgi:hypothetical protein
MCVLVEALDVSPYSMVALTGFDPSRRGNPRSRKIGRKNNATFCGLELSWSVKLSRKYVDVSGGVDGCLGRVVPAFNT